MGPLSFVKGDPFFYAVSGRRAGRKRVRCLRACARGGRLGDDADETDGEAVLGADLVPSAAVLAANVRAAGVFTKVKDLGRSKELRAPEALDGGVADQLGTLGHCGSSVFRMGVARRRASSYRGIVGA